MVKEFRLSDKVQFRRVICFVTGRRASGHFVLVTLHGTRIHDSAKAEDLVLLEMRKGYIQERGCGNSSPSYRRRGLLAER